MKWSIVDQLRDKLCMLHWRWRVEDVDAVAGRCVAGGWGVQRVVPVGRGLDHWERGPEGGGEGRGGGRGRKFCGRSTVIGKRSGEMFALEEPPPGGEKRGEQPGETREECRRYLLRQPRPLRWSSWPTRPHLPPRRL